MKIVCAQTGRSGGVVEKTLSSENDEFDRYLTMIPDDEFMVIQNSEAVHQDIKKTGMIGLSEENNFI